MKQLDALVGMEEVKGFVHEFIESIKMNHARTQRGFHQEAASLNFIFTGSPGTGKTTTARIMSQLLASLGYLEKGHLVEVSRADLVGKFAGHTADQMRQKCTEALGGTLLIDEAYALAQDEQDGYGKEAIAELLKFIEDKRGKLCVVATGYKKEMQVFIDSNSGMDSRFQEIVDFKDYSNSELVEIGKTKMRESQFEYGPDYLAGLSLLCYLMKDLKEEKFGNGRVVRNAFETAIRRMAVRLDGNYDTPGALTLLKGEDLPFERWTGLKLTDEFLSKFTWQDTQNGKTTTFAYKEIPTNKEFPELTTESKRILELILKTIKLDKELERNPKMLELQEPAASVKPESSLSFDEINSVELVPPSAGPSVEQTH